MRSRNGTPLSSPAVSRRDFGRLTALTALALGGTTLAACSSSDAAEVTTGTDTATAGSIVDETGRTIDLALPAQRVLSGLGGNQYILELIRAVGGEDRIVGATASQITTDGWSGYWDSFPGISPDSLIAGQTGGFNYDKILELNPDVLLTGSNSPWQEAQSKLAPFGIEVVVFTAWEPRFSDTNVALLGKLFGTEDQAEKYRTAVPGAIAGVLSERLAGLQDSEKKRVYFEAATDFVAGVPGGWDWVIRYAGGSNIYSDILINGGVGWNDYTVEPADILARNPDFIIKNGVQGLPQGFYQPWARDKFVSTAQSIVGRPGFADLTAIRDGNLWVTNNYLVSSASKWIGALYLASWLYPERFEGVDKEQYFRAWVEEYQHSQYIPDTEYYYHHETA
ncbi:ABC transporter substrate-binding protein [Rhodococcus jostii]|uniref:ABC transporter substrate-binding protein n=1 Tax=Rhodococcus jostii TaxID=132919 RepID=A0ABU4CQL3_RHOJO|nr:ABC transporter substrate-binding protein [Rhodococcus jostii]MDV6285852.1 ABC transporter substrate-binding protein [Rhodococcus jostii]